MMRLHVIWIEELEKEFEKLRAIPMTKIVKNGKEVWQTEIECEDVPEAEPIGERLCI